MKKANQVAFGLLCALLLGANIFAEHSGYFIVDPIQKILFAAVFCAAWTLFCHSIARLSQKSWRKFWMLGMFLYYIWILLNMLFFDAAFSRGHTVSGMNLQPFLTIQNYLRAYENGNISLELVVLNLIGNIAAFAPMAFFLPALFRPQRNLFLFTATIVLLVCAVEVVQKKTGTGSCDVDDLILNTAGALAVWLILLPWRLLHKEDVSCKRK